MTRIAICLALFALLSPTAAPAQQTPNRATIAGVVVDEATGTPLQGAAVWVVGLNQHVFTDNRGAFAIPNVPSGAHGIAARQLGYRNFFEMWTIDAEAATEIVVEIQLAPNPVLLEGLEVQVNRLQARMRAVAHAVRVYDRERILSNTARNSQDLVFSLTGQALVPCHALVPGSPRECVLVRGQEIRPSVWIDERPAWGGVSELETIAPHHIHRVEVYAGGRHVRVYTTWFIESIANRPSYRFMPITVQELW